MPTGRRGRRAGRAAACGRAPRRPTRAAARAARARARRARGAYADLALHAALAQSGLDAPRPRLRHRARLRHAALARPPRLPARRVSSTAPLDRLEAARARGAAARRLSARSSATACRRRPPCRRVGALACAHRPASARRAWSTRSLRRLAREHADADGCPPSRTIRSATWCTRSRSRAGSRSAGSRRSAPKRRRPWRRPRTRRRRARCARTARAARATRCSPSCARASPTPRRVDSRPTASCSAAAATRSPTSPSARAASRCRTRPRSSWSSCSIRSPASACSTPAPRPARRPPRSPSASAPSGRVVALDRHARRLGLVARDAERLGLAHIATFVVDASAPALAGLDDAAPFDRDPRRRALLRPRHAAPQPGRALARAARGDRGARRRAARDPRGRAAALEARRNARLQYLHPDHRGERERGIVAARARAGSAAGGDPGAPCIVARAARRRRRAALLAAAPRQRRLLRRPLRAPLVSRRVVIAPSILSADFGRLARGGRRDRERGRRLDARRRDGRPLRPEHHDRPGRGGGREALRPRCRSTCT